MPPPDPPHTMHYHLLHQKFAPRLQEIPPQKISELALQAKFYSGDFGLTWTDTTGIKIEAIHLGEWNRERGPDFIRARLCINGTPVTGDIELDPENADWERHGHATNPAFDHVILHVFFNSSRRQFFTRTSQNKIVCQVCLTSQIPPPQKIPSPSHPPHTPPSMQEILPLLESAAHFRLARKREAWLRSEALHGTEESIFQALATGLGYKNNKIPFLLVAQRCTLKRASSPDGEALLFGLSGFLTNQPFDHANPKARSYLRNLWERWWKIRTQEERLILPPNSWNFSACRPQNHPHRRLAALATLARSTKTISQAIQKADLSAFLEILQKSSHEFFSTHSSLSSSPSPKPCALIGHQRAADLAANLLAPAAGLDKGLEILRSLHPGSPTSRTLKAASWLGLPTAPPSKTLSSALAQQGLLQIYEDFYPTPPNDLFAAIASLPHES